MNTEQQPIVLKPADYSPDMPIYENPGSGNMQNCIPLTPQSYGPFLSFNFFGSAIGGQCLGAIAAEDNTAENYVFCGDATDLFEYTNSPTPTNVSQTGGGYTLAAGERWRFLQFGQRVLATDYDDPIQSFVLGTSTKFADLANGNITTLTLVAGSGYSNGTYALTVSNAGGGTGFAGTVTVSGGGLTSFAITNMGKLYPQTATIAIPAGAGGGSLGSITPTIQTIAPNARYLAVIDNFCVAANTTDTVNGVQPQRVWWSALNDPTDWPTPGSNTAAALQSSFNDLFGDAGWIMGVVGNLGNADGAVFMERAVYRIIYSGPPATFAFIPAEGVKGCPAPNSIIHLGPYAYYWAQDGIYRFDGSVSTPLGANRVDKTIYSLVDFSHIYRVDGAVDPTSKMIYWAFPSLSNSNGNPDTILAYNWVLDKFSIINQTVETIFYSMSFGTTLVNLPGGNLSQINIPLASRQWTGGTLNLSGFDASHRLGYFNGPTLQATVSTQEVQPYPGQRAFVQNTRPLVDGGLPTVALAARNRLIDTSSYNTPQAVTSFGTCPNTIDGRYIKAEIIIPAMSNWTHVQGIELECIPNGSQ